MPTLRPFTTLNGYDVINGAFAYSGTLPVTKGTFVKLAGGSGSYPGQLPVSTFGTVGAAWGNTVSTRYRLNAFVTVANSGDTPFGVLLNDVRETDENGELLIFKPQKQAEMECVLSGQAVPIAFQGVFDYSGVVGSPTPGGTAYLADGGSLTASTASTSVGKFLGVKDQFGVVRVRVSL